VTPRRIVLIGAARSGTKLLRDSLAAATGAGVVPYDIGYVWRIGQEANPHDALAPDGLRDRHRRYLQRYVDRHAAGEPPVVIEKTVGNSLRVPLVARALPDAVFVHLIRDGVDVVESSMRQWTSPVDLRYLAAKARTFPLRLAPRYGLKYVSSISGRRLRRDGRVRTWGVRYPGIDADLQSSGLLTVCARQWRASVTRACEDLSAEGISVVDIRYERLAEDPRAELARLTTLVGLSTSLSRLDVASRSVHAGRRGVGRDALSPEQLATVDAEAGDLLVELGYRKAMADDRSSAGEK